MKTLFAFFIAFTLAGCGIFGTKTTAVSGPTPEETTKAALLDKAVAASNASLFELTCPATGCIIGNLKVGNPAGAAQLAEVVRVAMTPQPSEASQNFRAFLSTIGSVGTTGIIGHAVASVTGKIVGGFQSGFDTNAKIADSGFAAASKSTDAFRDVFLKPVAPAANPVPTTSIVVNGNQGPVNVGPGTQTNNSNNPVNPTPLVCTTAGTPPVTTCSRGG